jgi:hypothetical protein
MQKCRHCMGGGGSKVRGRNRDWVTCGAIAMIKEK